MSNTVWVLTESFNDYDQHGDYLRCIWQTKPTIEQLAEYFNPKSGSYTNVMEALSFLLHIQNGGGRQEVEYNWYNLKEVEFGQRFDDPGMW